MLNHRYQYPIIPVTGQVLTQGHFGDLKTKAGSHSIGLYDVSTWSVATGSGNGKNFFIGYSSEATKDALDRWHFGRTDGKKSEEFRGKDLISFEYSVPKRSQKERWTVGWDGTLACNDLPFSFECGKTYGLLINLSGSPTWRRWAKNLQHKIYVTTPCCDSSDCTVGCPSNIVDNETVYRLFAEKINAHNELSLMGIKARYLTSDYTATSTTLNDYSLSVPDGGTPTDLANVQASIQAQAGLTTATVVRTDRTANGVSVYTVYGLASAPGTNYTGPTAVSLSSCGGVCPSGYTLTAGLDSWNLFKPLSGSEVLTTAADKQVYAYSVTDQYRYAVTGYTAAVTASELTGLTAHKFVTGQALYYNAGGGTAPTGITSGTVYYAIKGSTANTLKLATSLANALAGTAITITTGSVAGAAHSLTPVYSAATNLAISGIGSNTITSATHGLSTGQAIILTSLGTGPLATITTGTVYYVINASATTFKLATSLALALAGTATTITGVASGNLTYLSVSLPSVFTSFTTANAVVTFKQANGAVMPTAIGTDIIVPSATSGATCVASAPSTINWVAGQGYYKASRTLCMHIAKKDCSGASNLADIAALVAADPNLSNLTVTTQATSLNGATLTSGCTETFTVTQASLPLTDGCLSKDPSSYPPIPQGYLGENGISGIWEVVETSWPAPTIGSGLTGGDAIWNGFQVERAGLEIFAEVSERYLSDCSMQLNDFYETEPVRMEVSWVVDQMTGLPALCNKTTRYPKCRRKQAGLYQRQSGEWLLREYLKAGAYDFTAVTDDNARMREILDQTRRLQIDRKAYYKLYYIQYKSNKGNANNFNQEAEVWETMVAFKEDDPKAAQFEAQFGAVFSKFDITLQERK